MLQYYNMGQHWCLCIVLNFVLFIYLFIYFWLCLVFVAAQGPQGAVLNVEDAATRLHLLNRSALRSVQAQARTPGFQKEQASTFSPWGEVLTPIASSSVTHLSSSKQEEYVKVSIYHKLLGVTIYRV